MRVIAILILSAALGACSERPTYQTVARCELAAMRTYPSQQLETSSDIAVFIEVCMEAKGYQADLKGPSCIPNLHPDRNPDCYRRGER